MRKSRILLFSAVLLLMIALLAGCGANVSTVMNIDTADGGFSGSRVIELLINNDDLSKVTNGMAGLEAVLTENLPADLTYAVSNPSESQSAITFTLAFTSLDDYKAKISNVLSANTNNDIEPEILYEKTETIFKKGLLFTENFQSFDLLKWYYNALEAAQIISESSSNWYELGNDTLVIDGETVDTYGHKFDYDTVVEHYLDDCDVHTVMYMDGTFDRTITFTAYASTLEDLEETTDDFAGYMEGLSSEGIVFSTETNPDSSNTTYTYTMTGVTADVLVSNTNAVLQTQTNAFQLDIQPKEGVLGTASVTITEALDGSFYLNTRYDSVGSTIDTFSNFSLIEGDAYFNSWENSLSYSAYADDTNTFQFDWLVGYEEVAIEVDCSGDPEVKLNFTASEALPEAVRNVAFSALETACTDVGQFTKNGNTASCTFSGSVEEITGKLDAFVKAYAPAAEGEEISYCSVSISEMATASKFTNGTYGTLQLDLQPILGSATVFVSGVNGTDVVSSLATDEEGRLHDDASIDIEFASVKLNILTLILAVVFGVLFAGGVALCIIKREGFAELLLLLKKKPAPAPVPVAAGSISAAAESLEETPAPAVSEYAETNDTATDLPEKDVQEEDIM